LDAVRPLVEDVGQVGATRADHHAPDLGVEDRARAHGAGLEGAVQRRVPQMAPTGRPARPGDRQALGMRGRVVLRVLAVTDRADPPWPASPSGAAAARARTPRDRSVTAGTVTRGDGLLHAPR